MALLTTDTAGLDPDAGQLAVILNPPTLVKYTLSVAVPVEVAADSVPARLLPVSEVVQVPVNALVSSPYKLTVTVNAKFT